MKRVARERERQRDRGRQRGSARCRWLTYNGVGRTKAVSVDLIEVLVITTRLLSQFDPFQRTCTLLSIANQSIYRLITQFTSDHCTNTQETSPRAHFIALHVPSLMTQSDYTICRSILSVITTLAEWSASPDSDRKVVRSNPGVARSDGQWWNL